MPMRWAAIAISCSFALSAVGCRNTRTDLLEAELRTREREIANLRAELDRYQAVNQALEHDLMVTPAPPHSAVSLGPITSIELGRGTGGIDEDHIPGDEALLLVVVPKDIDSSALKVPGTLTVSAFEIAPEGVKMPLSSWEIPEVALRPTWKSGLFSTGYHVRLGWKSPPTTEQLRIVVQFRLHNGRVYETDEDIKIRPMLGVVRPPSVPAMPSSVDGPTLEPPIETEELPPPTKLETSHRVQMLPPVPMSSPR